MLGVHLRMIEHTVLIVVTLWVMKPKYEIKMQEKKMHECI